MHIGFENSFAKSDRIILQFFAFNPGLPALLAVCSSIAKCRMCDYREHNSRRLRRLNVAASDSSLVRRVRTDFSGELRVIGPEFGIAEVLTEALGAVLATLSQM